MKYILSMVLIVVGICSGIRSSITESTEENGPEEIYTRRFAGEVIEKIHYVNGQVQRHVWFQANGSMRVVDYNITTGEVVSSTCSK
jgi:hypothetical protein